MYSPQHAARLERIESLLQTHTDALANISRAHLQAEVDSRSSSDFFSETVPSEPFAPEDDTSQQQAPSPLADSSSSNIRASISVFDDNSTPQLFVIPLGHQTTTSSLLILPQVRALAGTFPHDSFYRLEARRPVPGDISFSIESP